MDVRSIMPGYVGQIPEVVYHYTTLSALSSILQDRAIWATSIEYLNDASEMRHLISLVRNRLPEFPLMDMRDRVAFSRVAGGESLDFGFEQRPFVASFTPNGDLLSQWRAYCRRGNGVSIGFSTAHIKASPLAAAFAKKYPDAGSASLPRLGLYPVLYMADQMNDIIDYTINFCLKQSKARLAVTGSWPGYSREESLAAAFGIELQNIASITKHHAFLEESEIRLAFRSPMDGFRSFLSFRESTSTLIPYVSVPFADDIQGDRDFLKRVIVGPSPNKELTIEAVRSLLRKQGSAAEVTGSEIPFREW